MTMAGSVMMMSACRVHSPEIDSESNRGDQKKLISLHFRGIENSLYGFKNDEDRDEDEEAAVGETAERFYA